MGKPRVEEKYPGIRQFLGMHKDADVARRFGVSSSTVSRARKRLNIPNWRSNKPGKIRLVPDVVNPDPAPSIEGERSEVTALELLRAIMDKNDGVIMRCQAELWNEIRKYEDFEDHYVDIMIGIEELQRIDAWTRALANFER
jgi:hypothetical protein